jgi:transcription elongation factor S-II
MSTGTTGVLLIAKGEVKRIKLRDTKSTTPLTLESLQTALKKKTAISLLHSLTVNDSRLTFFGYTTGKKGTENKHELPPPMDEKQYFSDILVVASKKGSTWEQPISFTPDMYEEAYEQIFQGGQGNDSDSDNDSEHDTDTESSEEEKEEQEEHAMTSKKKAAEDDGVPEDEEDGSESDKDGDDDEDGDGDEEEQIEDGEVEYEEEQAPVKPKKASKKKVVKQNLTVTQNTGRARQQALLSKPGFQEIQGVRAIPQEESTERNFRTHVFKNIQEKLGKEFTPDEQTKIESMIMYSALSDAKAKFVVKHFDNSLFQVCYMNAARRLISNLDPTSYVKNTSFLSKMKQGLITIDELATMTGLDYCPELYMDLRKRMALREQHLLEGNKAMATDMFKCNQCHKRETTYYELQTRSADEPMTKFINCLNCGNRWRQ